MKITVDNNTVILWKSNNIDLGDGRYMLVMYYYHTEKGDRSKSFYKCNIRIDTKENWQKLQDSLVKENPAEHFRNSMLGIDDDYKLYYSRHTFTKADMYKWIGTKFSPTKITDMENFEKTELTVIEPILRKYLVDGKEIDITDHKNIPSGKWFSMFKPKKQGRKIPRVIQ